MSSTSQSSESKEESKSMESSHDGTPSEDYFIVKNPLVLIICRSEYNPKWGKLPGVVEDRKTLVALFEGFYGWNVRLCENQNKREIRAFLQDNRPKPSCCVCPASLSLSLPELEPFVARHKHTHSL